MSRRNLNFPRLKKLLAEINAVGSESQDDSSANPEVEGNPSLERLQVNEGAEDLIDTLIGDPGREQYLWYK